MTKNPVTRAEVDVRSQFNDCQTHALTRMSTPGRLQPVLLLLVLFLCHDAIAGDPPTPITCNDPSFKAGGNLLGGYITPNELSSTVMFEASTTQYLYNDSVHFRVSAPKSLPEEIYLALQVTFTGADGEAQVTVRLGPVQS